MCRAWLIFYSIQYLKLTAVFLEVRALLVPVVGLLHVLGLGQGSVLLRTGLSAIMALLLVCLVPLIQR